jgi:hypothetical protein
MFAKFNRFDVHVKAVDGVNQKTILGACITLLSVVIVLVLVLSEISIVFKVDVISRMVADNTVGIESVRLDYGVVLTYLSYSFIYQFIHLPFFDN